VEPPCIEDAALQLYQLYDLGDSIDLVRARALLDTPRARTSPVMTRGGSIDMPQPPLVAALEAVTVTVGPLSLRGRLEARIYDLGIVAFRITLDLSAPLSWERASDIVADVLAAPQQIVDVLTPSLETLRRAIQSTIDRPNATIRTEEYLALVIGRLGPGVPAARLGAHPALLRAALGERRPLSDAAAALATTLSYYEDDLILLTWSGAIVIDPDPAAREDATFLLEVANAQLLAFRSYDTRVERDLAQIAPRLRGVGRLHWWELGAATRFQHEIHSLIVDSVETSARVENALKVTEDVYWNRVYAAALVVLRLDVWRQGTAQTLEALQQSAALFADEAAAARALLLEALVIALIAVELVVAIIGLRH